MSLWDPEAAGNAAVYLRLDDMKMMEIRSAPFEGGKAVWVPNSETGYMKADLIGDGDKPGTSKVLCVTVNPYKWLPVYDNHAVGCYKGMYSIIKKANFDHVLSQEKV